jgi:spore coat protein U-like protein
MSVHPGHAGLERAVGGAWGVAMRDAAMNRLLKCAARLLCVSCAIIAWAGRAEGAPHCEVSTTSVSFGSYDVFSTTATDSTGTVSYRCTGNTPLLQISLTIGSSATFNPRSLSNGPDTLTYNLYIDAARTSIWGDGTGSTGCYRQFAPPNGKTVNVTVYGRIPAAQDVGAGRYTDTITAIINF